MERGSASTRILRVAVVAATLLLALALPAAGSARVRRAHHPAIPRGAARFAVGAAREDITPVSLTGVYLGGYGIGPVHPALGVLRHIYVRVMAIRDRAGRQVVLGAIDAQGYSVAYQPGPYGFADIEADLSHRLGIPAADIILQSTHTHNGPDDIGVWGGVPNAYLAYVKAQTERAVELAVRREQPAALRWATASLAGYQRTFGSDTGASGTGDQSDYPSDAQLRVLQAVSLRGRVIVTLVNDSTHPTVYGPLNRVSPDWPGATATYLEHDEVGISRRARYGYPGSLAVVMVGAVGHTWPAGPPPGAGEPAVDPSIHSDNGPADDYGNAVARLAMRAVARHPVYLRRSIVGGASRTVSVVNTNPVLLAAGAEPANPTPLGGDKIMRSDAPPWAYGDVYVAPVVALRIGDLPLFSVPGEPYPSLHTSLTREVRAPVAFIFGLAEDQLGYVEEPSDYNGALQCSTGDEWFFTISPTFGSDVVSDQDADARRLGFAVTPDPLGDRGPGPIPPSLDCTEQQAGALGLPATGGLPAGL